MLVMLLAYTQTKTPHRPRSSSPPAHLLVFFTPRSSPPIRQTTYPVVVAQPTPPHRLSFVTNHDRQLPEAAVYRLSKLAPGAIHRLKPGSTSHSQPLPLALHGSTSHHHTHHLRPPWLQQIMRDHVPYRYDLGITLTFNSLRAPSHRNNKRFPWVRLCCFNLYDTGRAKKKKKKGNGICVHITLPYCHANRHVRTNERHNNLSRSKVSCRMSLQLTIRLTTQRSKNGSFSGPGFSGVQ